MPPTVDASDPNPPKDDPTSFGDPAVAIPAMGIVPAAQDLVLFQPAYPPAVWMSLGESIDNYQAASRRDRGRS